MHAVRFAGAPPFRSLQALRRAAETQISRSMGFRGACPVQIRAFSDFSRGADFRAEVLFDWLDSPPRPTSRTGRESGTTAVYWARDRSHAPAALAPVLPSAGPRRPRLARGR